MEGHNWSAAARGDDRPRARRARRLTGGAAAGRAGLPGVATGQELLERDGARAAAAAELGLGENRARADARRQPGLDGAIGVEPLELSAHQRPAAVVAEPPLVL